MPDNFISPDEIEAANAHLIKCNIRLEELLHRAIKVIDNRDRYIARLEEEAREEWRCLWE